MTVNQNQDARICVVGDFNSIRRPEDRVGKRESSNSRDIEQFEDFISQSNLTEIPLVGRTASIKTGAHVHFDSSIAGSRTQNLRSSFDQDGKDMVLKAGQEIEVLDRIDDAMGLEESDIIQRNKSTAELIRASLKRDEEDRWQWIHSCSGLFTVTSAYQIRDHSEQEESADQLCSIAFKRLWKSFAPRRYQAIIWKLLHNRMPTKDRLQRIGIIPASEATTCALCGEEKETAIHLFLFCSFAREVWSKIQGWLGITMVPHYTPSINFLQFGEIMGQGEKEKIISTIWVCTNWVLWNCRNKANFKGEIPKIDKMIGEIKARTWNWTTTKVKVSEIGMKTLDSVLMLVRCS
ncbi:hypothetical protein ACS0TY_027932 [Phlomoides rotata]